MSTPSVYIPSPSPPCTHCGVVTVVRLESLTTDTTMRLTWHCMRCHQYWPAAAATTLEQFQGSSGKEIPR